MKNDNLPVWTEVTPININGKQGKRLAICLRTLGCSYARKTSFGGCIHCELLQNASKTVTAENLVNQVINTFSEYEKINHLDLFVLGSFFDKEEIPLEARNKILNYLGNTKLERVLLESRPEYINSKILKKVKRLLRNVQLEIGIGVESIDKKIRENYLRKGYNLKQIEKAVEIISKEKASFLGYVLLKPPILNERESILDTIRTSEYIFELGKKYNISTRVAIEPFYVSRKNRISNSHLEMYKPSSLWSIIQVLKNTYHLGTVFVGMYDEGLSDGKIASNCIKCNKSVLQAIERFNGHQDISEFYGLDCSCKNYWKKIMSD